MYARISTAGYGPGSDLLYSYSFMYSSHTVKELLCNFTTFLCVPLLWRPLCRLVLCQEPLTCCFCACLSFLACGPRFTRVHVCAVRNRCFPTTLQYAYMPSLVRGHCIHNCSYISTSCCDNRNKTEIIGFRFSGNASMFVIRSETIILRMSMQGEALSLVSLRSRVSGYCICGFSQ